MSSFYEYTDHDMVTGREISMSEFAGKVVLVVNVASHWGMTDSNYTQLSQLWNEYNPRGLEILAFPSNQFQHQEPGTAKDILELAHSYDGADEKFVFFEKGDVNGPDENPIYTFLKAATDNEDISWNFNTFLISAEGIPMSHRKGSKHPYDELQAQVEELLPS